MICNGGIINGRNDQQICFREHQQGTLVFQNSFPDVLFFGRGNNMMTSLLE